MRFNKNKATRCLVISSAILATQGCGNASSTNVPKSVKDLTTTDITDAAVIARQAKWDEMATALGIGNNKAETSAELLTQLGSPSTYLTDATRATEFATLVGTLATKYASTSGGARCHSVTSVTYIDEAKDSADASVAAKVYMMKFKTYSDATFAAADDVEHAAYLTIPTAASANPILTYGHGGDSGIGYTEIKKNIGALQAATIVVAPTFPGESLCKVSTSATAKTCDESGSHFDSARTSVPYDNDADELLAAHNCVVKMANGIITGVTASDSVGVNAAIASKVKRQGAGTYTAVPTSVMVGSSRGSLAAMIALAKIGGHLSIYGAGALPAGYGMTTSPSLFNCAAAVAGPIGPTVGKARIYFELLVKGTLENSAFINLPGLRTLKNIFDEYLASTMTVADAKLLAAQRDITFNSPLIHAALRNWTRAVASYTGIGNATADYRGALLQMAGFLDTVVPYTDTKLAYNVLLGVTGSAIGKITAGVAQAYPGINTTSRLFEVPADYLDGSALKSGYSDHFDNAFAASTSYYPGAADTAKGGPFVDTSVSPGSSLAPLIDSVSVIGTTPAATLAAWFTGLGFASTSTSCKKAME